MNKKDLPELRKAFKYNIFIQKIKDLFKIPN